jgi:membrane protein YdbS with pleckstrin-like domain
MAFPKRLLVPGEELVMDLRPHPVALVLPALAAIGSLVVGVYLSAKVTGGGTFDTFVTWASLVAIAVIWVVYPVRRLISWLTSHFVITSDRVIHRSGWIAKQSLEIPLEQINDIKFTQGVFERLVKAGDIQIRSASNDGPTTFEDVRDPESVQKAIYNQSEQNNQRMYSGRGTPGGAGAPSTSPSAPGQPSRAPRAPSTTTELERLADLRAKGVLTEEEFQVQKAKILGRQ